MQMGARIRAARHLAGLRQKDIADRCGVSIAAISKFESDQCHPSLSVLMDMADALGTTVDFLVRPDTTPDLTFCHRKFRDLGTERQVALETSARVTIERRLAAEHLVHGDALPAYRGPRGLAVASLEAAEEAARAVRAFLGIGLRPLPDLTALLEEHGVRIALSPPGLARSDGLCSWALPDVPFIFVSGGVAGDRQRFTIAHELGHLTCDLDPALDEEAAGHRFAGSLLIPREALFALRARGAAVTLDELLPRKREYGISLQALLFRCRDCGVISNDRCAALFRDVARRGWRTREPDPVPAETPTAMASLLERALAQGLIGEPRAAELAGVSLRKFLAARGAGALVPGA